MVMTPAHKTETPRSTNIHYHTQGITIFSQLENTYSSPCNKTKTTLTTHSYTICCVSLLLEPSFHTSLSDTSVVNMRSDCKS